MKIDIPYPEFEMFFRCIPPPGFCEKDSLNNKIYWYQRYLNIKNFKLYRWYGLKNILEWRYEYRKKI